MLTTKQTKYINWISGITMLALLILAAWFWRERTWFLDVAFQTCLMIKDGTVQVQVYRFGSAVVQFLPLMAIKMGWSLTIVSFLYSISFPLIYLGFWWLIVKVFQQPLMGLALAFLYVAMTYDGFYWCTSELQQGLGFLLVVWAMILRYPFMDKGWHWIFILLSFVALAFYHPLVFIPFFFCWVYFGSQREELQHRYFVYIGLLMIVILWAKSHWFGNWYDDAKMVEFKKNLNLYFPNYFSLPAYKKFLTNSIYYWWGLPIMSLIVSIYLLAKKKFFILTITWGAIIGFLLLNAIGSPDPSHRFYSEVNYYPLIIFASIPFCYFFIKNNIEKRWLIPFVALFISLRLLLIGWHHQPYSDRIDYLTQLTQDTHDQYGGQRFITSEQNVAMDTLIMSWATPFESMLITASVHPDSVKTLLITPNTGRFTAEMQSDSSLLLMEFNNFSLEAFEKRGYLKFDKKGYRNITIE